MARGAWRVARGACCMGGVVHGGVWGVGQFGSCAAGLETVDSDLDLQVQLPGMGEGGSLSDLGLRLQLQGMAHVSNGEWKKGFEAENMMWE